MDVQRYKQIFEHYGGLMRTKELEREKIRYRNIQQLIEDGLVEKCDTDITNGSTRMTSVKPER